jgi:hypothetical protein
MLITYLRKPDGRIDEQVSVSRRVKTKDLQTANVIMDFQDRRIVQASMNGTTVPRDWQRIVMYYYEHYRDLIDQLAEANGYRLEITETTNDTV